MDTHVLPHNVFVLMGVSGSGKSAVANTLSRRLNAAMLDGDFLHPRHNIKKMAGGEPLNDNDRLPWLKAINDAVFAMQRTQRISFIVCSALKKSYRDILRNGNKNLFFIHLYGDYSVIEARLKVRKNHFFKTQMLVSQFKTLEMPGADEPDVFNVNIKSPLEEVVASAMAFVTKARHFPLRKDVALSS